MNRLLLRFLSPIEMTRMDVDNVGGYQISLKGVISNPLFGCEIFQAWIGNKTSRKLYRIHVK